MQIPVVIIKIKNWLKRKITLRNINRYTLPLTTAITNFNLVDSVNPAISTPIIILNSIGILSGSWMHNYVENFKKDKCLCYNKTFWSLFMLDILITSFVVQTYIDATTSIESTPNKSPQYVYNNIKAISAAASIIVPWLINNASNKFFTLSEDLLDDDQIEILNIMFKINNTLSQDEQEQLKEELANFSDSSKKYLFECIKHAIVEAERTSNNTPNIPEPLHSINNAITKTNMPNIVPRQDILIFSGCSSNKNDFIEPVIEETIIPSSHARMLPT